MLCLLRLLQDGELYMNICSQSLDFHDLRPAYRCGFVGCGWMVGG